MSDDIEGVFIADGDLEDGASPNRSEVYTWSAPNGDNGMVIFPRGVEQFADDNDVQLVRIGGKSGLIEILQEIGGDWRAVDRPLRQASIKAIKND